MDKRSATVLGSVGATLAVAGVAILLVRRALVKAAIDREYEHERLLERYDNMVAAEQLPPKKKRTSGRGVKHNGHAATH